MVNYAYFGPNGERASRKMADSYAAQIIGSRVMIGFDAVQRSWFDDDGRRVWTVYLVSSVDRKVWAVYYM